VPQRVDAQTFIIDAYEHRKLAKFETFFNITVWFACFPPDEPHTCHLFLNRSLAGQPVTERRAKRRSSCR
jgi:hypothetical protein